MSVIVYELAGADPSVRFSPHCWKIIWALKHKGLEFDRVPLRFNEIRKLDGKTVPVIHDGGRVLRDSFEIALHLEETYPDRPSLFAGEGGHMLSRFVERWTQLAVHSYLGGAMMMDLFHIIHEDDRDYFRASREARFGRRLEEVPQGREDRLGAFRATLQPVRAMVEAQPFIGGASPLFADYIVAGALQWARVASPMRVLEEDDPLAAWFERILDLHGGIGRATQARA